MLERDFVIKLKFTLAGIRDVIVTSLTMHPGDLLPIGLPYSLPEYIEKLDSCGRFTGIPVGGQTCRIYRHEEFLYVGFFGAG